MTSILGEGGIPREDGNRKGKSDGRLRPLQIDFFANNFIEGTNKPFQRGDEVHVSRRQVYRVKQHAATTAGDKTACTEQVLFPAGYALVRGDTWGIARNRVVSMEIMEWMVGIDWQRVGLHVRGDQKTRKRVIPG